MAAADHKRKTLSPPNLEVTPAGKKRSSELKKRTIAIERRSSDLPIGSELISGLASTKSTANPSEQQPQDKKSCWPCCKEKKKNEDYDTQANLPNSVQPAQAPEGQGGSNEKLGAVHDGGGHHHHHHNNNSQRFKSTVTKGPGRATIHHNNQQQRESLEAKKNVRKSHANSRHSEFVASKH